MCTQVNDISLYAALGYHDFAWIVEAKLRWLPTDEMTLFQFLLLNEECVAEDYVLLEEFQGAEQYAKAETSESGLCAHLRTNWHNCQSEFKDKLTNI